MMPEGESTDERTPLQPKGAAASAPNTTTGATAASAQSSFMSEYYSTSDEDDDEAADDFDWEQNAKLEMRNADKLSRRLLAIDDNDNEAQDRILRTSLRLTKPLSAPELTSIGFFPTAASTPSGTMVMPFTTAGTLRKGRSSPYLSSHLRASVGRFSTRNSGRFRNMLEDSLVEAQAKAHRRVAIMVAVAVLCAGIAIGLTMMGFWAAQPPRQPVGPYILVERQEGDDFFTYYDFYEGPDSVGSNGYNTYVSRARAETLDIVNVTYEDDALDVRGGGRQRRERQRQRRSRHRVLHENNDQGLPGEDAEDESKRISPISEPFVYLGSAPTADGPRESIRLEGKRRFNRGLFIIDVRHMPNGCGMWPAFWLTDEANWPVNGEIDIVEGVNYQSRAKTALHSTQGCDMFDIPIGTMTGGWDTSQGIPNADTGIPDMTMRYAQNCFVYDQHQWLNQGCVAVDLEGGTIGGPLNAKGGGVYVLEWDPINTHIRSWVFTPHESMPLNLVDTIRTAHLPPKERVAPNPELWPLPYGYFSIGVGTSCPANHFQRMRIVLNTAFCGSVAGNRYFLDCPRQFKQVKTCNEWIKSNPEEMEEAYWKIRGVYVYERAWEVKLPV